MSIVWLGLGSNIGDRFLYIEEAITRMSAFLNSISMASFYETAPRDFLDQPDFLNTVIRSETNLEPIEVLKLIHKVEAEGGRERNDALKKGPRTIDIDILLFDEICATYTDNDGSLLTIPHKNMHERLFVLKPLLDLNSKIVDPRDGISWSDKASHLWEQRVKLCQR